jgi:hypothetical protein
VAAAMVALATAPVSGGLSALAAEPSAREFTDAVNFRSSVGFPKGDALVQRSYEDRQAYPDDTWGVPLSRDEADEMTRRIRNRTNQRDAVEYAKDQPDFGGLWFDQLDGGAAYYTFTSDIADHRRAINSMTPDGAEIEVSRVENRMSDLTSVKERISREMPDLIKDGFPITMVDANARANRVIVYLERIEDGDEASLADRYGDDVIVERLAAGVEDACNGRGDCRNPIKGGLRINPTPNLTDCTSAFQAKRASGDRVIVTAGHCLKYFGGSGVSWKHNNNQFGVSQGNSLTATNVEKDVGWILIDDVNEDKDPADRFYRANDVVDAFDGQQPDSQQAEGDMVCRSGEQSGWDCGVIVNDDIDKPNGAGHIITHVHVWDKDSLGGDSGGTMVMQEFIGGQAAWLVAGLHIHSTNPCSSGQDCRSWYNRPTKWRTAPRCSSPSA